MLSNDTVEELDKLENFIYDNSELFLREFTNIKYPELVGVWFSSDSLKVHYWDTDSGQHFSDVVVIDKFENWLKTTQYDFQMIITAEMVKKIERIIRLSVKSM